MPQNEDQCTAVDRYIADLFVRTDLALDAAREASNAAGLPAISVSPNQGKLLMLMAQSIRARKILEIGTLGGYSTIWLARALPLNDSNAQPIAQSSALRNAGADRSAPRVITLEYDPKHAEVARKNIARAGFANVVEVRQGRAQDSLPQLVAEGVGPFDFIFIDADKPGYPEYLSWSLKLSRVGTVIIADN